MSIVRADGLGLLLIAAWIFLGTVGGIVSSKFNKWRQSWRPCPHGVKGGEDRQLCDACIKAKQQEIAERQRAREIQERIDKIKTAASQLRRSETARLVASLVPDLSELRSISPQKFEDEIARMFRRRGYEVTQTPYTNDVGRDAILKKDGETFLVECKRYAADQKTGRPDLQRFAQAISDEPAQGGFFVTTGGFTSGAIKYAEGHHIVLVYGTKLVQAILDSKPDASENDTYQSMCGECGSIVHHRLRAPRTEKCPNNHAVMPTLTIDQVLSSSESGVVPPNCIRCGTPMKLIHGKRGPFWGCSLYPKCRYSLRYDGPAHLNLRRRKRG
jgi:HJR/Mrr/RecB family endonuclease